METIIYKTKETPDNLWLQEAGKVLAAGGLVAIPTETVYGLAANGLDAQAAAKIYSAKGRPSDNPLIIHISEIEMLKPLVAEIPEKALRLAEKFWPGPLTMVFAKSSIVPYGTTGGLETVAVRMPSHPVARKLIRTSRIPLAAPSANTSGRPSPTRAVHVYEDLNGKIDMILDDGPVGIGIESTIVDLTGTVPMILRPGYITKAMLSEVVGEVRTDPAIMGENKDGAFRPKAPGMKYRHYAPHGTLLLVSGAQERVVEKITSLVSEKLSEGSRVGVIGTDDTEAFYRPLADRGALVMSIGSRRDENSISHNLYNVLRQMDAGKVDFIYSESFEEGDRGPAIMNRLLKAAGHRQIHVS